MATTSALRSRRNAAQLHALAQVEREIRATDPNGRRKYLRDFNEAFLSYEAVLQPEQLEKCLAEAQTILVGDYHALPASQKFAAQVVEKLAQSGPPVALALETIFARDQHILDEWMQNEIDEKELRERIRFDLDWGYDWQPFYELLARARAAGATVYGLDCMPRSDMRKIGVRDRHAAEKIAELRKRQPETAIVVLFGESHLAPNHLPQHLRERLPEERVLTVLQNMDTLYWRAAGERCERVDAVRVREDVVCVFNSTPLEKYESYRMCLERWSSENPSSPDLGPTIYNLIEGLLRFLNVKGCSPHNGTQPKFLVDLLPEVYCRPSDEMLRKLLLRKGALEAESKAIFERIEEFGSAYLPRMNAIYVRDFQMGHAAEEAAHFVHLACRGVLRQRDEVQPASGEDAFYTRVLEQALGYLGSRVLYPARTAVHESDLYTLYTQPREAIEEQSMYGYAEYMRMIDFLVLHKDFEANQRRYWVVPELIKEGVHYAGEKFQFVTRQLGYMLGSEIYDSYLQGKVAKRYLRALYFRSLEQPGTARETYLAIVDRIHNPKRKSKRA
jgi:hypothetical protein